MIESVLGHGGRALATNWDLAVNWGLMVVVMVRVSIRVGSDPRYKSRTTKKKGSMHAFHHYNKYTTNVRLSFGSPGPAETVVLGMYVWPSHITTDWAPTDMVANPPRGQMNRGKTFFPVVPVRA